MTVEQLIELLRQHPDQRARVVFRSGNNDGSSDWIEPDTLIARMLDLDSTGLFFTDYVTQAAVPVVELE